MSQSIRLYQDKPTTTLNNTSLDVSLKDYKLDGRRLELFKRITSKIKLITTHKIGDKPVVCWEWTGGTSGKAENTRGHGYGKISIDGSMMLVHRVMFTIMYGIIAHKKEVDHRCCNRLCANPEHLQIASRKQNQKLVYKRKKS